MGNEAGSGIDRAKYEKEWANNSARWTLVDSDKSLWATSRYTVRPYLYFDKILVAWVISRGQPKIKDIFTVTSLDVNFQDGIWVRMRSKVTGREHLITHTPRILTGIEVFAWIPFFNEMRFASADWENPIAPKNLRLSACFKMQERADNERLLENIDYLTELHVFRQKFPAYADTRF